MIPVLLIEQSLFIYCKNYRSWLVNDCYLDWDKQFTIGMIGIQSKNWAKWVRYSEQEWNIY